MGFSLGGICRTSFWRDSCGYGAELRTGNIWENVELPRLMKNPNVTKITTIDPKTGVEKIIFER